MAFVLIFDLGGCYVETARTLSAMRLKNQKTGQISISIQISFSKYISYLFFIKWYPDWMRNDVVCVSLTALPEERWWLEYLQFSFMFSIHIFWLTVVGGYIWSYGYSCLTTPSLSDLSLDISWSYSNRQPYEMRRNLEYNFRFLWVWTMLETHNINTQANNVRMTKVFLFLMQRCSHNVHRLSLF